MTPPEASPLSSRYRVLVVEDTEDQRDIIRLTLRPMEVVTAVNGLDGLMKIDRVQPDFIISDVMMPEMDGWEFVKRVRQRSEFSKTPVVFLTALSSRDDMKKGYETGADVYLTKPYDPTRLKRNLEVFTEKFNMQPRPKARTMAELEAEEQRLASAPALPTRSTLRGSGPSAPPVDDPFRNPSTPAMSPSSRTAAPSPAPRPPTPKPAPPVVSNLPRILLVTADKSLFTEITAAAPASRSELVIAKETPVAMDKTSLYHPDALLLHWQFPDRRGPVLAQLISESPECKGKPLIVITDTKLSGGETRLLENLGIFETLRRPIDPKSFSDLLTDIFTITSKEARAKRMPWHEVQRLETGGILGRMGELEWED